MIPIYFPVGLAHELIRLLDPLLFATPATARFMSGVRYFSGFVMNGLAYIRAYTIPMRKKCKATQQ